MRRECGECTLCCKLLPVRELDKKANTRCQYQKVHKGCTVHNTNVQPLSCKLWNCRWLVNDDTADLSRPDRSHYVIDIVPDFITAINDEKIAQKIQTVQIWVDPKHRDAHRDPKLREYLMRLANKKRIIGQIRYGSEDCLILIPPSLTSNGEWIEKEGVLE
jgi:hypothetical protein